MDEQPLNGHQGLDAEVLRRLRLNELLRDLVRERGRMEAAALVGVNYKTLVRAEESGRLTVHMMHALERLQLSGESPAEAGQRERVGGLERRMEQLEADVVALAEELRAGVGELREAAPDGVQSRGEARSVVSARTSEPLAVEPTLAVAGMRPRRPVALRRPFPDVVTVEPADDDADVYGEAWALVEEWRWLRSAHPHQGSGVRWLETEARILALELALLEEHGLTLPPETQPLRGFARRGQTTWRRTALHEVRQALTWAKLRRFLTLGLWWR